MMKQAAHSSNLRDWRFCSVCRRNHEEGRKHIFTKQHQNKLKIIMKKFTQKVRSARQCLSGPVVCDGELEPGKKVWCYCCEQEVNKHVTDGSTSIQWGGLIEHLTKPEHHKRTREYWWEHGVESGQLQMFLVFPGEYQRYQEQLARALSLLEDQREKTVDKLTEEVRAVEEQQAITALEPPSTRQSPHPKKNRSQSMMSTSTSTATTSGLASIRRSADDGSIGNVHTGAIPPWLREDSTTQDEVTIGPSEEEFIKHKERVRNAGKNPKRVGADFHLKLALQKHRGEKEDDQWLPSFGRVWNAGPRSHTQSEFRREMTGLGSNHNPQTTKVYPQTFAQPGPSRVSSILDPVQQSSSQAGEATSTAIVKPYVRRRHILLNNSSCSGNSTRAENHDDSGSMLRPYVRKRKLCDTD